MQLAGASLVGGFKYEWTAAANIDECFGKFGWKTA